MVTWFYFILRRNIVARLCAIVKLLISHSVCSGYSPERILLLILYHNNCREEHKSHSGKCAFLTHNEDELTVRQFLELVQSRMIFRIVSFIITARVCSTREGNVYTWECLSVHRVGVGLPTLVRVVPTLDGVYLPWIGGTYLGQGGGTYLGWGYLTWQGGGIPTYLGWEVRTLYVGGGGLCCGRYASCGFQQEDFLVSIQFSTKIAQDKTAFLTYLTLAGWRVVGVSV